MARLSMVSVYKMATMGETVDAMYEVRVVEADVKQFYDVVNTAQRSVFPCAVLF